MAKEDEPVGGDGDRKRKRKEFAAIIRYEFFNGQSLIAIISNSALREKDYWRRM